MQKEELRVFGDCHRYNECSMLLNVPDPQTRFEKMFIFEAILGLSSYTYTQATDLDDYYCLQHAN